MILSTTGLTRFSLWLYAAKSGDDLGVDLSPTLFLDYLTPTELISFFGLADEKEPSTLHTPTESQNSNDDPGYKTDSTNSEADNSVIEVIRTTIVNEIGVPVSDLTPTTPFNELGIDSLLSLTISGKLTESLKVDLSTSIFMENDNFEAALSRSLGLSQTPEPKKLQTLVIAPVAPVQPQESSQRVWTTCHIQLWGSPQTAEQIISFFPAGSGSSSYAPLSKLDSGTAAYGLNYRT